MVHKNFINGKWVESTGGTYEHRNPADLSEITGLWPKSSVEDVNQAIEADSVAFASWSGLTVYQRAE